MERTNGYADSNLVAYQYNTPMLQQKIQTEMNTALKAQNKVRLDVLRFILSQIKYAQIDKSFGTPQDKQKELTDGEIITVLQKEVKKRNEAIELFKKFGKSEGVPVEEEQIAVIREFLPKQLSKEEIEKTIEEVIASSPSNLQIGQIIGIVMRRLKDRADGSQVASLVREKLQNK